MRILSVEFAVCSKIFSTIILPILVSRSGNSDDLKEKTERELRLFNLNVVFLGITFLAVLFKTYGKVFEKSERVLLDRKVALGDKWFRRFHRSCRPLTFEIGGLYFVDPGLSLTVGSFVAQSVAGMLILGA